MKRGVFIGTGTILLVFGVAGLALLQTDLLDRFAGTGTGSRLETPPPVSSPETPGQAGQSRVEGKLPAPSEDKTAEGPKVEPSPASPAEPQAQSKPGIKPEKSETPAQIPPVLKGERRFPKVGEPAQPHQYKPGKITKGGAIAKSDHSKALSGKKATAADRQSIAIKFRFNPAKSRDLKVARVHLGDRVAIKIRRVGQADRQIYLGFDLPEKTMERSYPYYGKVVRKSAAVITPVRDTDQLSLKNGNQFDAALSRRLASTEGAVLKVVVKQPRGDGVYSRASLRENGHYEIEMRIYSGNRWNIKPRSFL